MFELAALKLGWTIAWGCENAPYARQVYALRFPGVRLYDDIRTMDESAADVDIMCGGFPCQDVSNAGEGLGINGPRSGLWREYARLISLKRPRWAVIENVSALLRRGLGTVLKDLAQIGYDAQWHCLPSSILGAPHKRDRIWVLAYPHRKGRAGLVQASDFSPLGPWGWRGQEDLQLIASSPFVSGTRWPQPLLRRMDDGRSHRVDRLQCIGNAIVPGNAEVIFNAIQREENR